MLANGIQYYKTGMLKLFSLIILLSCTQAYAFCQMIPVDRTPLPGEEKELLAVLKDSKPGIGQIETSLNLSGHYIFLPGEEKADLEKAMSYAIEARKEVSQYHLKTVITRQCF